MIKFRIVALILALMMTIMLGTACSSKTEEAKTTDTTEVTDSKEVTYKDTIVYALWSSPDGFFNPALSSTIYDEAVDQLVYDSMISFDKDMNIVPLMADSYEVSEDEKTIVFNLKEGMKWHDGEAVTTDDIVFTFESLANKDYTGPYSNVVEGLEGYEAYHNGEAENLSGIKVDGQTVSFTLGDVYAPALMNIGGFDIIPKHVWESVPVAEWGTASELLASPVGCGPYKFEEYEDGHHLKLTANENYFDGEVATKNFIFRITSRDNVQVQLENGEVDIADISDMKPSDIEALKTNGIETESFANNLVQYMGFNLRDERFKDERVRAAFMYGLDRQLMVDTLVAGKGQLVNTPMIPSGWAYPSEDMLLSYEYNIEKAKALLKEAGWEDRDQNGIIEDEAGNEFKIVLTYPTGDKAREESAPIIQSYVKELGIDMELEMLEFKATMAKVVGNHEFDVYLMGNSVGSDPDPKPYWHSTAMSNEKGVYAWNIAGFANEEADKLMEAGLATTSQEERKEIYNKFGVLMNKELPWATLYSKDIIMAHNPKIENYHPSTYTKFVDVEDWKIEN